MKFSNVRLLVNDFANCFKFYTEQLGLEPAWGDATSGYASFKVADGIEGLALFVSDWMAPSAGNADKQQMPGFAGGGPDFGTAIPNPPDNSFGCSSRKTSTPDLHVCCRSSVSGVRTTIISSFFVS